MTISCSSAPTGSHGKCPTSAVVYSTRAPPRRFHPPSASTFSGTPTSAVSPCGASRSDAQVGALNVRFAAKTANHSVTPTGWLEVDRDPTNGVRSYFIILRKLSGSSKSNTWPFSIQPKNPSSIQSGFGRPSALYPRASHTALSPAKRRFGTGRAVPGGMRGYLAVTAPSQ